jgi:hypothetical protein
LTRWKEQTRHANSYGQDGKKRKGEKHRSEFPKALLCEKLTIQQEENFEAYNGTGNEGQTKPATGQNGGIEQ